LKSLGGLKSCFQTHVILQVGALIVGQHRGQATALFTAVIIVIFLFIISLHRLLLNFQHFQHLRNHVPNYSSHQHHYQNQNASDQCMQQTSFSRRSKYADNIQVSLKDGASADQLEA
jgi:fumarate reductase subunit C